MPIADTFHKIGSVGLLLPNLEARLMLDAMDPCDAKEGDVGELWIRGASIMKVGPLSWTNSLNVGNNLPL
jgi:4-coumarate--CoA ligase